MFRKRKVSSHGQSVEPRKGYDSPAGKVSKAKVRSRSHRKKPRSYVTLPFGVRVVRKSWYLGLVTVAAVAVLLGVLLMYAFRQYTVEVSELSVPSSELLVAQNAGSAASVLSAAVMSVSDGGDPTNEPTDAAVEAEPLSLGSILDKYRTASGMSEVQGIILHGNYAEDGREFAMKLLAKSPGLVRKTLKDDALEMICRYDGETANIEIEDPEGKLHQQALTDALYQQAIILEGAVLALASDQLPDVLAYKWEADQTYDGQACWTIRRRMSTNQSMIHLLDPETGLERVRFVYFMHGGQRQQLSLHLSDYRQQGAGALPFGYTLKFNGKLRGEAKLDSIQLNPGLMPWMF